MGIKKRDAAPESAIEASPNAVSQIQVSARAFCTSINSSLLGKYFGEISIARIKKSTLPYVVLSFSVYPLMSLFVFR
jgi:hypothetical protein